MTDERITRPVLLLFLSIFVPAICRAQSGDFEISEIDTRSNIFTGKSNGQFRAYRVRPGADVSINGVRATFAELETGMKVKIISSEPGIASSVTATGIRTKKPPLGPKPTGRHMVARIAASSPDAFPLGAVQKGPTITLRYRNGKWKSFGRFPTSDPNDEQTERWTACRMAISHPSKDGKAGKTVTLVPAETQRRQFIFDVTADYPLLVLRINDEDGSYDTNPGMEEYSVTVTPPK